MTNLGNFEITRQQTPVDIGTISDIRVVVVCCGLLKDLLYEPLVVARLLQEQLYNSSENLQLGLRGVSLNHMDM